MVEKEQGECWTQNPSQRPSCQGKLYWSVVLEQRLGRREGVTDWPGRNVLPGKGTPRSKASGRIQLVWLWDPGSDGNMVGMLPERQRKGTGSLLWLIPRWPQATCTRVQGSWKVTRFQGLLRRGVWRSRRCGSLLSVPYLPWHEPPSSNEPSSCATQPWSQQTTDWTLC